MQGFKKELLVFNVNQITFGVKLSCKCRGKKKYKPYHPRRLIRICFFLPESGARKTHSVILINNLLIADFQTSSGTEIFHAWSGQFFL